MHRIKRFIFRDKQKRRRSYAVKKKKKSRKWAKFPGRRCRYFTLLQEENYKNKKKMKEKTTSLNSQPQALKKSFKIKNDVGGIERERQSLTPSRYYSVGGEGMTGAQEQQETIHHCATIGRSFTARCYVVFPLHLPPPSVVLRLPVDM